MTKQEIEARKQYERALFERVKNYVKNEMTNEQKDRIFRIAQNNPIQFEILKDNPNYEALRDRAIAGDLLGDALAYEIQPDKLNKKFVDKYIEDWDKISLSEKYVDNAIKGLKSKFPEQYTAILLATGDSEINVNEFKYQGANVYIYKNVIISFDNSPAQVEIRVF